MSSVRYRINRDCGLPPSPRIHPPDASRLQKRNPQGSRPAFSKYRSWTRSGTSDADGFIKLSSRVVASDAGKWKMNVFNPETRQQVNPAIQVKIGNGPDKAHQPFWTSAGNFSVYPCHHTHYGPPAATPPMMHVWIKVGRPGVPIYYQLVRE